MHDIRFIRENPETFDAGLKRRGAEPASASLLVTDSQLRAAIQTLEEGQNRRKVLSKEFGDWKRKGSNPPTNLIAELESLKVNLPSGEKEVAKLRKKLRDDLDLIPNLPAPDVPDGADENANVELDTWGNPRNFDFKPKEHADLGPDLGLDFETGAKLSGSRFTFLRGNMAKLHRALGQWMLDQQTGEKNGYIECNPPLLVNDAAMYGTDKLPKFAEDSYSLESGLPKDEQDRLFGQFVSDLVAEQGGSASFGIPGLLERFRKALFDQGFTRRWLIPTAEVSLTASVQGEILDNDALPMRMTALTQCFRSEAGSAGKDTRGFIRQHQFEKCELVSIVRPEESEAEHERMTECAEGILKALELPYRKVLLCTGDMGFGARKTYDLEVWLPGQGAYREISSCSNTGDFQARRMNTRYRPEGEKKTEFPHTLNGSGLAVGRTLVAVLENYQNADGSVTIPEVLRPYMGGIEKLEPQP
ncbi:serine--tRNA ligase [Pontixanthobacter aestiaquae]|uniref:Serine--tRNA ligase n=1 Tax=Pontixanthobacter aestiaquae TaxID=1509367 RepID=A0A844Z6A0_9SPHN|nr:serine--tRNA ligase [Pontixanthobacter aestiaquae]MDN3646166.1 serine--tRNA ligase [Pontixanthobacter aestiaquae]MXO82842.1 serine--tRNA ligase [Pontixanthobacter aestiaquae]